jgi:hypothetical protein
MSRAALRGSNPDPSNLLAEVRMAHSTVRGAEAPSLVPELLAVLRTPARDYPILISRARTREVLFFPAVSGVYVAYVAAERLHLGDALGFGATAVGVVLTGAGLGLLALAFTVYVLHWSARAADAPATMDVLSGVFGYATWPFLPLLLVLVPLELWAYGASLFSSVRPVAPAVVPVLATVVEASAIVAWLYLMLRGTAVETHVSNADAARTLVATLVRMAMILVLFVLIAFASFMI